MPQAVILTALPVEYLAVRSYLDNLQEVMHPQGTIYERSHFTANGQTWDVGIAEVGAGNAGAAVEAERAIAYFNPDILFFVGIAGGIKDVKIGDVVAATKVYGYESGKVGETFSTRPAVGQSAYAVIQRAKSEARKGEWVQRLSGGKSSQPRVFVAPIAAGEKVIASRESELFQFIRGSYNDAIAIEMEGFGFLSAAFAYPHTQAIVIRGISDLIDDKNANDPKEGNEEDRQERASYNASAFAFEVLSKLPAPEPRIVGENVRSPQVGQMVQNNTDQAKGFQTRVEGGTNYIGEIHIHNHPSSEDSTEPQGSAQSGQDNFSSSSFERMPPFQVGQPAQASSEPSNLPSSTQTGPSLNLPQSAQTMSSTSSTPKIFISYSHDFQAHKDNVLELADRLRNDGLNANIDQYENIMPEGLPRWMMNQVEEADYVLVVCTEQYDRRFRGKEEKGRGKGGDWEGAVITQELYDAQGQNSKFIPIAFTLADKDHIPIPLRSAISYRLYHDDGYEQLYRRLTDQHDTPRPVLGQQRALAPRARKQFSQDDPQPFVSDSPSGTSKVAHPNFFALDDQWVGRETLIQELSDRIQNHCRLLMLVGITGIGKTALGERLAVEIADWFENDWSHFHQENFDDEQQTSDFASVAARWLEKWGELVTPEDRKDPQRLLNRTIQFLRENRYVVQMDSLENILQGNEEEGWSDFKDEWWLKFFTSYIKADACESCIVLTSQDLPGQLEEVGTRSQNFWHCQPLSGLGETEQIALFEKTELDISPSSEGRALLERVGKAYEGHPLALRVIAGEIRNRPFNGNVVAYWNKYGNEVEEVENAIAEAQQGVSIGADDQWRLDRFTKSLRRNVRSRLDKTFARLKKEAKWAYLMLCSTSVYRRETQENFWLSHLDDWDQKDKDEQRTALDMLRERYLVEELTDNSNQCLLRQHNLIRSVSLEHLKRLDEMEI